MRIIFSFSFAWRDVAGRVIAFSFFYSFPFFFVVLILLHPLDSLFEVLENDENDICRWISALTSVWSPGRFISLLLP